MVLEGSLFNQSMSDYTSIIIRFNWPHPVWERRSKEDYRVWLIERINLFQEYTARSLLNLYDKPDSILLLINSNTLIEDLRARLLSSLKGIQSDILFGDAAKGQTLIRTISDTLLSHIDKSRYSRVISMRLDSDDLIASFYVASIRSAAAKIESESCVVSLPGGAIFEPLSSSFYYSSYPANPFIAYLEPLSSAPLKTVFKKMHVDMLNGSDLSYYIRQDRPAWASVVHGGNLANMSLLGGSKYSVGPEKDILKLFGISNN